MTTPSAISPRPFEIRNEGMMMKLRGCIVLAVACSGLAAMASEEIKLPPEVTPALRAACEADVRRHCIGENPSIDKVRRCVEQKYMQFGNRCRVALVTAGLL